MDMDDFDLNAFIAETYDFANNLMVEEDSQLTEFSLSNRKALDLQESIALMLAGFVPTRILDLESSLALAITRFLKREMTAYDLIFWYNIDPEIEFIIDAGEKVRYGTVKGWIDFVSVIGSPLVLGIIFPYKVYQSGRPKNDMSRYHFSSSMNYTRMERRAQEFLLYDSPGSEPQKAFPVTRYGSNAGNGLYYADKKPNEKFCGTFYYLEPGSKTYLVYQTSRIYKNKIQAYEALAQEAREEGLYDQFLSVYKLTHPEFYTKDTKIMKAYYHRRNALRPDLKMSAKEYFNSWMPVTSKLSDKQMEAYFNTSDALVYVGSRLDSNLYAYEDFLDQPLCNLAKFMNIDVILLYDMIGSTQIVAEILDSREREQSLANLYFPYE